jgi:branched-subunit amino acid transport protein
VTAWIVILSVAGGTYALRASMFVLLGSRTLPTWTTAPMALVAPAAIAALVASLLFTSGGRLAVAGLPELAAVVVGFVAVRRSGNVMHAFVFGLPAMWLLEVVVP